MPRKSHNHRLDLPPLELDCMRMLWALGNGTVHEIRARLLPERPLAYTTVMTVMTHLRLKGIVDREKRGRSFVYRALVPEETVREHALDRLTRNFFVSSRASLRSYLTNSQSAAPRAETRPARGAAPVPRPRAGIDPSLL